MGLREKALSGFIWTSAGTVGNGLLSIVVTIILARLLTPGDFALVELLVVFVAVSNVIVDSGFSQAIIRDDEPSETDLSSVFWTNLCLSAILYVVLFFAAPIIADYFHAEELILYGRVAFLVIIFNAFSVIQNAVLNRRLDFAKLNKASVLGALIAGIIAVVMAFTGFGIWALIANMVLMPLFRSLLLWISSGWKPQWVYSIKSVKKYFKFGGFLMLDGIIDTITMNLTSLIIGRNYTKDELGYYSQGKKLDSMVVTPTTAVIKKVSYPVLSKIRNEKSELKRGYTEIMGIIAFVFIPLSFFVISSSDNMVVTLFGDQWKPSGIFLGIFAFGSMFYPLQETCINIILVNGKSRQYFIMSVIRQSLRLAAIICFVHTTVLYLTIAYVSANILGAVIYICYGFKEIKYNIKEVLCLFGPVIIAAFVSALLSWSVGELGLPLNVMTVFALQVVIMLSSYFILTKILRVQTAKMLLDTIKGLCRK